MFSRLQKNDLVLVIAGDHKGKRGKISQIFPKTGYAVVLGVNLVKRRQRSAGGNQPPNLVEQERPIHQSNLALVDPESNLPVKIGFRKTENSEKVRVVRATGRVISRG
jgi:large subunit ribosomal protein L24